MYMDVNSREISFLGLDRDSTEYVTIMACW